MKPIVLYSRSLDAAKTFDALGIKFLEPCSLVAVKMHFGEAGNKAYLKPKNVKPVIDRIIEKKAVPFLTDANTLYKGTRANAASHLRTAYEHGYSIDAIGAPVVIADGLTGKESVSVPVGLKHFKEVKIGAAAYHADSMIVLTHFKGHELTGFGGSLKNVGMGLGTRAGKQMMHSDFKPKVDAEKCTRCGCCVKWCPTQAISLLSGSKAKIDLGKCIGCGECVASCNFNAIEISWAGEPDSVQEKMVEYFYGVWKEKKEKMAFFNFVIDVSPNCDCYAWNDAPVCPDVGLLASYDPVALDQASVDLVNRACGSKDKWKEIYPDIDSTVQLRYAESLGIGKRNYEITEV